MKKHSKMLRNIGTAVCFFLVFSLSVKAQKYFNVADYGAKNDSSALATKAIEKAISAASKLGGGTIYFGPGKYLTGPIHLKSNITILIDAGAELHFSDNFDNYLPMVPSRWEGTTVNNFSPLFYAYKADNIAITGRGLINGNGKKWWATSENFTNVISEIHVGKNAKLTIDKLQEENETCSHIATELVNQQQDSNFTINTVTLNGLLVRNNLTIEVNGQNCETNLNGAYILNGNQHVDNHTVVDHKVANCESNELYKGVIDGKATAVFNGKVFVRKDAQKINAFQSNGNVLLSDDATINSKPELEIYADDVKCSHGSTTGQLDEEAVFYLRARGLSEASARQLMVGAFIEDVTNRPSLNLSLIIAASSRRRSMDQLMLVSIRPSRSMPS